MAHPKAEESIPLRLRVSRSVLSQLKKEAKEEATTISAVARRVLLRHCQRGMLVN